MLIPLLRPTAKVIVTGDNAVRRVGRYMDIEIMTPAEFLARQKCTKPGASAPGFVLHQQTSADDQLAVRDQVRKINQSQCHFCDSPEAVKEAVSKKNGHGNSIQGNDRAGSAESGIQDIEAAGEKL